MSGNKDAVATVAVRVLAAAREFSEGTLGVKQMRIEGDEVLVYAPGSSCLNVYSSLHAGITSK